jgi:hypothetical protein
MTQMTGKPFHIVFETKDKRLRSVLGDLFPDGMIDYQHLHLINTTEDYLITCWDYERKKYVSFWKSKIQAYKELE